MDELSIVPRRRKTDELRKGRVSVAGATYFVTFSTKGRAPAFANRAAILAAHDVCRRLVGDGDLSALTVTVMPDHVHLLFKLGENLALERVVAKWRTLVWQAVRDVDWQSNFFDHRLWPGEMGEPYAWYVFMNPYRAGLVTSDVVWPGWWTDGGVAYEFLARARPGPCPQPEWIAEVEREVRRSGLVVGE